MEVIAVLFRLAIQLMFFLLAFVMALGLLFIGVLSVLWVLLRALLTGRKPAFVVTLQRFEQARRQFRRGGRFAQADGAGDRGDVVDVVDARVVDVQEKPSSAPVALPPARDRDQA
jgi:hypothetical protein